MDFANWEKGVPRNTYQHACLGLYGIECGMRGEGLQSLSLLMVELDAGLENVTGWGKGVERKGATIHG